MGGTLNYNVNTLQNDTIPKIRQAKATLSDCRFVIASISVPLDFPEGGRIRGASGKIGSIISLLSSAETSVSSSVSQINKAQALNDRIVSQLFEPMVSSLGFSTNKSSNKSKKGKTGNAQKVSSILGITIYEPGKQSKDRNIVGNLSGIGSQMGSSKKFTKTLSSNLLNLFLAFNNANTKTNATMANGIVSIIKGAGNVGENLLDAVYTGTTWLASQMKVSDPKAKEYMQQNTMSFVAEEHVNNVFYDFYNKNDIGKELDKFAYEPFKSTGVASNLIEGLAYEGTMAVIATATGGGAAALAAVAGAAGFGRETQNSWAKARDNANGEEWRTEETFNKGVAMGVANGLWEAITHGSAAQAILSKVPNTSNVFLNSAARVASETVENAFDTPVRAVIDTAINNKDFNKAFEEQGGWTAVASSALLALAGGTIGEVVEFRNTGARKGTSVQSLYRTDFDNREISDSIISTPSSKKIKLPITEDTVIRFNNGVQDKEITWKELKRFKDEELDLFGRIKNDDIREKGGYFYEHETNANEMTMAFIEAARNYDIDIGGFRIGEFIRKYHSSLDEESIALDNWAHSGLIDELQEKYGDFIFTDLQGEEKRKKISERVSESLRYFTGEEFKLLGQKESIVGFNDGEISYINVDAIKQYEDYYELFKSKYQNQLSINQLLERIIKDTMFHESLHHLSSKANFSGVRETKIGKKRGYRKGLNEAITETFTFANPNSFPAKVGLSKSAYLEGTSVLRYILQNRIIEPNELKRIYFENDVNRLDSILKAGTEKYSGLSDIELETFYDLMDEATLNGSKEAADKIVELFNSKKKYYV